MTPEGPLPAARRDELNRRVRLLAWFTVVYNTAEGIVAVTAGVVAGSVALVGFGLDSGVEVLSALAVGWQFNGRADARDRERTTLRLIAVSFFALAAYVTVDALRGLLSDGDADPSAIGIVLACASLVVMPLLVRAKRRAGRELGSATVAADATQTELCTYLSAVLLAGLLLNTVLGWAWADPLVGLVIAAVAVREGLQAWRGDTCCAPASTAADLAVDESAGCCPEPCGCAR
ncbi:MAG: cation diffusion facilitator family transporter [Sporichthyaceae bacterium]